MGPDGVDVDGMGEDEVNVDACVNVYVAGVVMYVGIVETDTPNFHKLCVSHNFFFCPLPKKDGFLGILPITSSKGAGRSSITIPSSQGIVICVVACALVFSGNFSWQ